MAENAHRGSWVEKVRRRWLWSIVALIFLLVLDAILVLMAWDVYDESKKRAQRVQGESLGRRGGGGDPWSSIDQTIVAKAASDSMDAIASFLVTAPVPDKPAADSAKDKDKAKTKTAAATSGKRS